MHTTTHLAAEVVRTGGPASRLALTALFERILERIYRYFLRALRDPNEADECLQQTVVLLEASLREGKYEPQRSFNTWMWLKARTVFAQWCREREKRRAGSLSEGALATPADPVQQAELAMDADTILTRVRDELRPEVYETFLLYYLSGMTQEQVAEALDCTSRTVRNRIGEAHDVLARVRPQLIG